MDIGTDGVTQGVVDGALPAEEITTSERGRYQEHTEMATSLGGSRMAHVGSALVVDLEVLGLEPSLE